MSTNKEKIMAELPTAQEADEKADKDTEAEAPSSRIITPTARMLREARAQILLRAAGACRAGLVATEERLMAAACAMREAEVLLPTEGR